MIDIVDSIKANFMTKFDGLMQVFLLEKLSQNEGFSLILADFLG